MNEVECPELAEGQHAMYILLCKDESYYVGSTNSVKRRLLDHKIGKASVWTKKRSPVQLVYFEIYQSQLEAMQREKQLKGWTRIKKERLINGEWTKK